MTTPVLNQPILFKISSSPARTVPAVVSHVIDDDTINLVAFADINETATWPLGDAMGVPTYNHASWLFTGVSRGTGVGEWQDADLPGPVLDALAGKAALAAAGTDHVGVGLNAPRQPSATRSTRVTATGTIALTSTILTPQSAAVDLRSDASNPPSTSRGQAPATLSGVAATVTLPWSLTYDVPAGHFYELVGSGAGTITVLTLNETAQ